MLAAVALETEIISVIESAKYVQYFHQRISCCGLNGAWVRVAALLLVFSLFSVFSPRWDIYWLSSGRCSTICVWTCTFQRCKHESSEMVLLMTSWGLFGTDDGRLQMKHMRAILAHSLQILTKYHNHPIGLAMVATRYRYRATICSVYPYQRHIRMSILSDSSSPDRSFECAPPSRRHQANAKASHGDS